MSDSKKANPIQGTPQSYPKIFMGLATRVRKEDGSFAVRFLWSRVWIVFIALSLAGWITLSAAIFFYFKYGQADFDRMTYFKALLLPFRLDEHRRELGDYHIEQGLAKLAKGDLRNGLQLLRVGVTRSPGNIEGRMKLSQIYINGHQRGFFPKDFVLDIIEEGLPHGRGDLEYMRFYFKTLLLFEEDVRVIEFAEQIRVEKSQQTQLEQLSASAAANAYFLLGRYAQAEALISDYNLMETIDGLVLSARMDWNRGQKQAALSKLESSRNQFSNNGLIFDFLIRFYRQLEDYDKALYYSILYSTSNPLSCKPRIGLLYAYRGMGREEAEAREIESIMYQFEGKPQELLTLAGFATETRNVRLAERLYERGLEGAVHPDHFSINLMQCYLEAGDYDRGVQFAEELREENPEWLKEEPIPAILSGLLSVAYSAKGEVDLSAFQLKQFLQEKTRMDTMLKIADLLTRHGGGKEQARRVLLNAYEQAPENSSVLIPLIKAELTLRHTENLSKYFKPFFEARQPSKKRLEEIYTQLCSDHFIFVPDRSLLLMELKTILNRYQ